MYPHERSLVKRLAGKPFALIGVNSDDSVEKLSAALERENITWPSFFDGGGTGGPIALAWGVTGWPTIYVLDEKGVIRFKKVRGERMDEAVNTLLAEMGVELEEEPGEEPGSGEEGDHGKKDDSGGKPVVPAMKLVPAEPAGGN
jgi:hypothetical protein